VVTYPRLSVTDRCDMRRTYCNGGKHALLYRRDVLSPEELYRKPTTRPAWRVSEPLFLDDSGLTRLRE
jgi:hypothetical protein